MRADEEKQGGEQGTEQQGGEQQGLALLSLSLSLSSLICARLLTQVFPGVGSFGAAMEILHAKGLVRLLSDTLGCVRGRSESALSKRNKELPSARPARSAPSCSCVS